MIYTASRVAEFSERPHVIDILPANKIHTHPPLVEHARRRENLVDALATAKIAIIDLNAEIAVRAETRVVAAVRQGAHSLDATDDGGQLEARLRQTSGRVSELESALVRLDEEGRRLTAQVRKEMAERVTVVIRRELAELLDVSERFRDHTTKLNRLSAYGLQVTMPVVPVFLVTVLDRLRDEARKFGVV